MDRTGDVVEVPGYPGNGVTLDGRIFTRRSKNGKGYPSGPWRPLRPQRDSTGRYLIATFGRSKILVHKAMMMAFIGPRPDGQEIAHVDGDCRNNHITNLVYVTHQRNEAMKQLHGTAPKGQRNGMAKLDAEAVCRIREYPRSQGAGALLARQFGVSQSTISLIRSRKRWSHV
jgi:hypothetical protein